MCKENCRQNSRNYNLSSPNNDDHQFLYVTTNSGTLSPCHLFSKTGDAFFSNLCINSELSI